LIADYAKLLNKLSFFFPTCTRFYFVISENQLTKEFEACVSRLERTKKRFVEKTQELHKRLKDFSGKSIMAEADAYVKDLQDIQEKLDDLGVEVRCFRLFGFNVQCCY